MVCLNVQRKYSSFAVKQEVFFSCFSTPDYARYLIFFVSFVLFCAFLCFNRDQIKLDLQQTWPWLRLIMSGCHASLIRSMTLVLTLRYLINVITRHQEKRKEDIKSLVTCPRLLPNAEFEVRNDRFFFPYFDSSFKNGIRVCQNFTIQWSLEPSNKCLMEP